MSRENQSLQSEPPQNTMLVHPFYHEAKNEVIRPDRSVHCSQYFVTRWMPLLGGIGTCIVLYLRSRGGDVKNGEVAIQINQDDIAQASGCSDRTIRREMAENDALRHFVRTEERFVRGERGRVRRLESVYYIAMDDPLHEDDKAQLEAILARKTAPSKPTGKVILPAHVIGQNDRIRDHVIGQNDRIRHEVKTALFDPTEEDKMSERILETNVSNRNVSETRENGKEARFRGKNPETDSGYTSLQKAHPIHAKNSREHDASVETWRQETENLARYSARELDDSNSLGYHIKVWHHARKTDRQQANGNDLTDGVFEILRQLCERRRQSQSHQPLGKAWTRRTRKWFSDMGFPLLVKADEAEMAEVRSLLADAPFMREDG